MSAVIEKVSFPIFNWLKQQIDFNRWWDRGGGNGANSTSQAAKGMFVHLFSRVTAEISSFFFVHSFILISNTAHKREGRNNGALKYILTLIDL